jgi:ferritin-like metal-binding protein YciE
MPTDELINWLNDAYAMELGLAPILDNHARDAAGDSGAHARLQRHAAETRRHAELLQQCVERLGGRVSLVRATVSAVIGGIESVATAPFRDELVKNALMDYASEHFEIACYRALIIAAREAGRDDVGKTCEKILAEEVAMASWLENQIPTVVLGAMRGRATRA